MIKRIIGAVLFTLSLSTAQDPILGDLPRVPQRWDEIRQYLALSETQVAALEEVMRNRSQAEQQIHQQIAEKERQMYGLLQQGSNDASTIGRLMVDINNLRRQLPLNGAPYRTQALAALNDPQKAKLAPLVEAVKLQPSAWQAIQLNLIDNPVVPDARILPFPMPLTRSAGAAESAMNAQ